MKRRKIDPLTLLGKYGALIDKSAVRAQSRNRYALYGMLRYFMGYANEQFASVRHPVGKRVRPGLALLIAEAYGVKRQALPAALSIELFHNFTLIHDDIVDHDELRRGRPTVWRLWGVDHAINSGDAQLLLVFSVLEDTHGVPALRTAKLRARLIELYLDVIDGQYLDFTLAASALGSAQVSQSACLTLLAKKTGKLIRAATEASAIIAGRSAGEIAALGEFGESLGIAYQLYDDYQSIWGDRAKTGKKNYGDLFERKKTLPIVYARDRLSGSAKKRLIALYAKKTLTTREVIEIARLIESVGAREELLAVAQAYKDRALKALTKTTLPERTKTILADVARTLVPESVTASR